MESMDPEFYKKVWNKSLPVLVENLVLEEVLVHLRSIDILREQDEDEVNAQEIPLEKVKHLVGVLKRHPTRNYVQFLNVLQKTNQRHIAAEMRRLEDDVRVNGTDNSFSDSIDTIDGPPSSFRDAYDNNAWVRHIIHAMPHIEECLHLETVLVRLRAKGHFSAAECHKIEACATDQQKNHKFIAFLIKKHEEVYRETLRALRMENQPHVANLFEGINVPMDRQNFAEPAVPSQTMSHWHKTLIDKNCDMLVENMEPKMVVIKLRSLGVFSRADSDNINVGKTRADKVMNLLDLLMKKEDTAFDKFLEALNKDNQEHLAEPLRVPEPARSTSLDFPMQVSSPTRSQSEEGVPSIDEIDMPNTPDCSTEEIERRLESLRTESDASISSSSSSNQLSLNTESGMPARE